MLNVAAHWRVLTTSHPFLCGGQGRPLRIVVDDETVDETAATRLLHALGSRNSVEVYTTDPAGTNRLEFGPRDEQRDLLEVRYVQPSYEDNRAVFAAASLARLAEQSASEYGHPVDESERVLFLAQACARHDVDALATAAPLLDAPRLKNIRRDAAVTDAAGASALLGLHLRAHNDFTVRQEGGHATFIEGDRYYRGAAVAALPGYPRWLEAAVAAWRADGDPTGYALLRGLEVRLGRALRARDYFNIRIRAPRPDDTWDEALFFFESLLLLLSGALDAAARFCHLVYGVGGSRSSAGWQRKQWRGRLIERGPELAPVLAEEDSRLLAVTTLVQVLRNYIHGEALSQESHGPGPETVDYQAGALAVEGKDAERLRDAADTLGGAEVWGLEDRLDGELLLLPAGYQRRVLGETLLALQELMEAVDPKHLRAETDWAFAPDFWLPGYGFGVELTLLTGLWRTPGGDHARDGSAH